jgi:hypothetical protein
VSEQDALQEANERGVERAASAKPGRLGLMRAIFLFKPALIAIPIYIGAIALCVIFLTLTVSDPIAMPWYGVILALPWSALLRNVGNQYYALAMNVITLYAAVVLYGVHRRSKKKSR